MKFYFKLQYKRLVRWLKALGIHPILMAILVFIAFGGLVSILYVKTNLASYLLCYIALFLISILSSKNRNELLVLNFYKKEYYKIRIIENLIMASPFIIVFLWKGELLICLGLILFSNLLIFLDKVPKFQLITPTPFSRIAYESIIGFRKNIIWILGAYFLAFKALQVDNFNLGLFSVGFLNLIGISAYIKAEQLEFVWIHNRTINEFLNHKIFRGILSCSLISFPIGAILIFFYPLNWWIVGLLIIVCYLFLIAIILAKYSAFPNPINLPQIILLGISLFFPPLILFVIFIFYNQSKKRLITIL